MLVYNKSLLKMIDKNMNIRIACSTCALMVITITFVGDNFQTGDVTMSNGNPVEMDSKSNEDKEKKNTKAVKTKNKADTNLLKEKTDADYVSNSPASGSHENKDPLKTMSGSVSEDDLTSRKQDDVNTKDLERNDKGTENVDSVVSEEFADNTRKNHDEASNRNGSCEHDTGKSPSEGITKNEACENDTRRVHSKPNTNSEDLEDNTDNSSDGGGSKSTDDRNKTSRRNNCDSNSKKRGFELNRISQNPDSLSCGDQVQDEAKSEAAACTLPKGHSVEDQKTESSSQAPLAVCNNVLSDDANSQDSGIGVTQPQTTSDADIESMESGNAITMIPGKFRHLRNSLHCVRISESASALSVMLT